MQYNLPLPSSFPTVTGTLNVPDFFALLSYPSFWSPVLFWAINALLLPLAASYFINLSSSRKYDPFTFSVAKALVAYVVYTKQLGGRLERFGGLFGSDVGPLVSGIVGEDAPFIGAAIGGLATVWDGIVKTR